MTPILLALAPTIVLAQAPPCSVYASQAQFEADHAPFARSLNTFEDFELTSGPRDSIPCPLDSTKRVDCLGTGTDPSGFFCAGNSVDAGDILNGLRVDTMPERGPGAGEVMVWNQRGDHFVSPNYYGDATVITFLDASDADCPPENQPEAVGLSLLAESRPMFGAQVSVTLTNGRSMSWNARGAPLSGQWIPVFTGMCCEAPIAHIRVRDDDDYVYAVTAIRFGAKGRPCP